MSNLVNAAQLGCCHINAPTGSTWFPDIAESECQKLSIHAVWTPGPCPQHGSSAPGAKTGASWKVAPHK